jgi:hypothetical protein
MRLLFNAIMSLVDWGVVRSVNSPEGDTPKGVGALQGSFVMAFQSTEGGSCH